MKQQFVRISLTGVLGATVLLSATSGEEPERGPRSWIQQFQKGWDETAWTQKTRRSPGYMRPLDDRGWQLRMLALQRLVAEGEAAVPALLEQLDSTATHERIFAAQALSYLAPHVPGEPLLRAADNDPDAAVRLYSIDALCMRGGGSSIDWPHLLETEQNRDAQKHIGYAVERGDEAVGEEVVERLKQWDHSQIDSAVVGRTAPDFELQSATGETVRLSQYRGSKAVVLVFIYGDT